MSEDGDYTPATYWKGHDFSAARASFDVNAGRGYAQAKAKGLTASKLLPLLLTTSAPATLTIDTDFTGSMNGWDKTICSKMPILDHEMRTEYLGEDAEVSFGAICDTEDDYPLQIRVFAKHAAMKNELEGLIHASGGSGPGSYCEAHGLAMLYRARNVEMPKALNKPIYIIITDEMPYNRVTVDEAKSLAKVVIEKAMTIEKIVDEVKEKYSLYVILKPYHVGNDPADKLSGTNKQVYDCWKKLVGEERIALLPDPNRVVDVIFGLLAQEVGKVDYFRKDLEKRQLFDQKTGKPDPAGPAKVETVYRSLKTVHALPKPESETVSKLSGKSATKGLGKGKPTSEW